MFSAIVMAGERPGGNALKQELGLVSSVLVKVAGKTALQRVFDALQASQKVSGGLLCGPSEDIFRQTTDFEDILSNTAFQWSAPESSLSASAIKCIKALDSYPILLTTGDLALLTPELIDSFCSKAENTGADIVVGLTPYSIVHAAYPESRRTVAKYSDGGFCGTNLFAIMTPAAMAAVAFWQSFEVQRKQPWKIANRIGLITLLRYVLRRISLAEVFQRLSNMCGCQAAYVVLNDPRAAVDVDTVADRDLVEKILQSDVELKIMG